MQEKLLLLLQNSLSGADFGVHIQVSWVGEELYTVNFLIWLAELE